MDYYPIRSFNSNVMDFMIVEHRDDMLDILIVLHLSLTDYVVESNFMIERKDVVTVTFVTAESYEVAIFRTVCLIHNGKNQNIIIPLQPSVLSIRKIP